MNDLFELEEVQVRLIRHLAVTWDAAEVGAPTIEPLASYGSSEPLADLARLVLGIEIEEQDPLEALDDGEIEACWQAHASLEHALEVFVVAAELPVGTYSVTDHAAHLAATGQMSFGTVDALAEAEGDDGPISNSRILGFFQIFRQLWRARHEAIEAAQSGPSVRDFELRPEHLAVMRGLDWDWKDNADTPGVAVPGEMGDRLRKMLEEEKLFPAHACDAKRPYGSTDVERDLREALKAAGLEVPEDDDPLYQLHWETQTAFQALFQHGRLESGTYRMEIDVAGARRWRLV